MLRGIGRLRAKVNGDSIPSGAIAQWWADEYQSSPRPHIPNTLSSQSLTGLVNGSERLFSDTALYTGGGVTVTDLAVTGPTGSQDAATFSCSAAGGGGAWQRGQSVTMAAGTYTVVAAVKRNAGTDQQFVFRIGSNISPIKTATSSWQRFSYTWTHGGGAATVYLWSANANGGADDAELQVHEFQIHPGSSDLGAEPLTGHLGLAGASIAGNEVDITSGFGVVQFDTAQSFADAFTYVCVVKQVNTTYDYATLLHGVNLGSFDKLHALATRDKETFGWFFNGSKAEVQREHTLLFNGKGYHVLTFRYNGSTMDTFVDDVLFTRISRSSLGTVSPKDFFVGRWGGARANHKMYGGVLYNRALSNSEVLTAFRAAKAKAAAASLTVNTMDRVLVCEGDSLTAPYDGLATQSYAYKYGANANPFAYTSVQAFSGNTIANLESRAATIDSMLPSDRTGRKFILSVLIGANDLATATTGDFLADLASYCDDRRAAGWTVVVLTLLPQTTSGFNTKRNSVNTEIRLWTTNGSTVPGQHADYICDLGADSTIGEDGEASNTTYYEADGIHLKAAGQTQAETVFRTTINAIP
jgi:hypothetical protein